MFIEIYRRFSLNKKSVSKCKSLELNNTRVECKKNSCHSLNISETACARQTGSKHGIPVLRYDTNKQ